MPVDLSLEDAEDKPQPQATNTAVAEDGGDDCEEDVPAKRQRRDVTVPESYTTAEPDAVNKVLHRFSVSPSQDLTQ